MDEKDLIPELALAPLPSPEEIEPEFVTVNGNLLSVQNYKTNPQEFNAQPFDPDYVSKLPTHLSTLILLPHSGD